MKKILILPAVILCLFSGSCSREEVPEYNSSEHAYCLNYSNHLVHMDMKTLDWNLLCSDENCPDHHLSMDCDSVMPVYRYRVYENNIFYTTPKLVKDEAMMCLVHYDTVSGKSKVLASAEQLYVPYLYDNQVYIMSGNNGGTDKTIQCINISSGKRTEIGKVADQVHFMGILDGKLIFSEGVYGSLYTANPDLSGYTFLCDPVVVLDIQDRIYCNTYDPDADSQDKGNFIALDSDGTATQLDDQQYHACITATDGTVYVQKNALRPHPTEIFRLKKDGVIEAVAEVKDHNISICWANESYIIAEIVSLPKKESMEGISHCGLVLISIADGTYQKIE